MSLYLIGIGLGDEQDITLKGLNALKTCTKVYLEVYTSHLAQEDIQRMEKLYGKKIERADRETIEQRMEDIVEEASVNNVAVLIVGSPLSATTHMEFLLIGKKQGVPVHIIDNASILTAVAITGLFLYKFGRTTTIPLENKDITSPYEAYLQNKKSGLHTLFLLDIQGKKMMTAEQGCEYLMKQGLKKDAIVIGCGGLGSPDQEIIVGKPSQIKLKKFPQCLILPGELNFKEEEALNLLYKN
jgi:diphthine synthase